MEKAPSGPRKILIFSLVYYPRFIGGAEIAIKEITDRIPRGEYEFHMVTLRLDKTLPKEEKISNVFVYRVGFVGNLKDPADSLRFPLHLNKYLLPFIGAWKAHKLQKQNNYDAVWAMMANYAGFGALFFKFLHPKVPFILTLQEGDPIEYIKKRVGVLYALYSQIFMKANSIQVNSHYLGDFARSMGYEGRVVVVPNAVDTKRFSVQYGEQELNALKEKLGKKEGDVFLITTSRLVVKNAVDDVIRSLVHLPYNVKFLVLGQGYEEDRLKALALELGVEKKVIFAGYVDHADMPKYLKISDIFIRPSLSEGFGNSFVEAMAAGIPVIATPVGGIVDFLFDPDKNQNIQATGLFCEVKNPQDIARQVRRLLENPALRAQLTMSAKKMVFEKYDWNIIAKDMEEKVFDAN
jgi:glycosyltransferase involved in cell wall biosynthesis